MFMMNTNTMLLQREIYLYRFQLQLFSDSAYATGIGCYIWEDVALDDEGQRDCRQKQLCIMPGEDSIIYSLSRRLHANSNHVNKCVLSRHSSHMCENIPVSFL